MNLQEKFKKGFRDVKEATKALLGTYKVINNTSSHGRANGTSIEIIRVGKNGTIWSLYDVTGTYYNLADLEARILTIEELGAQLDNIDATVIELQKEKREIQERMNFMTENDIKEYDENIFKTYQILKTIKKTSSDMDKAKAIAEILKQ